LKPLEPLEHLFKEGLMEVKYFEGLEVWKSARALTRRIYDLTGTQEFIQFLSMAKGSCGEVRCQLYVAFDRDYLK
jgi:23S rRNA-intervening sequence protein